VNRTDRLLWWAAFRPQPVLALGICAGLFLSIASSSLVPIVLFAVLAGFVWMRATQFVNREGAELLQEAEEKCRESGAAKLGIKSGDGEIFLLRGQEDEGRFKFISIAAKHRITTLYATPSFLGIFADSSFDLMTRRMKLGTTTRELYYLHISAVEYSAGRFKLVTTSGERVTYQIAENPEVGEAALSAVRQHLRKIHAVA